MAGTGERWKGGCCRRHPKAYGGTFLIAAGVSLAVLGVALGIRSYLEQTFLDTVQQVRYYVAVWLCAGSW